MELVIDSTNADDISSSSEAFESSMSDQWAVELEGMLFLCFESVLLSCIHYRSTNGLSHENTQFVTNNVGSFCTTFDYWFGCDVGYVQTC